MSGILSAYTGGSYGAKPNAPTIGTATATSSTTASVTFTANGTGGLPITSFTATSSPGNITGTGSNSPITVSGLTTGVAYTFTVTATNAIGTSNPSLPSNSVTPINPGSDIFTAQNGGTYTWVAPAGVTSVSVVAVGGGGSARSGAVYSGCCVCYYYKVGSGGGGLGWKNNISVVPGNSYTVVVGRAGIPNSTTLATDSYFINTSTVRGGGGGRGACPQNRNLGGTYTGDGGGNGGTGKNYQINIFCCYIWCGSGAGGYTGNGGGASQANGQPGQDGSGGGGGGSGFGGGGGGGVGLYGQGANGVGGQVNTGGGGGSGGNAGGFFCGYRGGNYGGGIGYYGVVAGSGAVRIVWPGNTRQFPSTNVGSP